MRQKYVLDLESMLGSKRNVLVDVPLRVNKCRRARLLVSDNVGRMSQARQVELFKNHATSPRSPLLLRLGNDPQIRPWRFPAPRILLLGLFLRYRWQNDDVLALFPIHW